MSEELFSMFGVPSHLWEPTQSSHAAARELVAPLIHAEADRLLTDLITAFKEAMDEALLQMSAESGLIYCPVDQIAQHWRGFRRQGYLVTRPDMDKIPYRYQRLWMIEVRRDPDSKPLLTMVITRRPDTPA